MHDYEYFLSSISKIKGIGKKSAQLFLKKRILNVFDLLWHTPTSNIEISKTANIDDLQIGKIQSIKLIPTKYNFPRIRNLPNRVNCLMSGMKIDCIFFNSYEGYIKKILPMNSIVTISGKVGYYKNKYQITNPTYISTKTETIKKIFSSYSLSEGLTEKKYRNIISEVLTKIPDLNEWLSKEILEKFDYISWKKSILDLHDPKNIKKKRKLFK